jgi:hypothetical protein
MVLDGAHQHGLARRGLEQRLDEEGGGGFSVGAGDAGGRELPLRVAEEGRGSLGERAAAVLHLENGQTGLEDQ